MGCRWCVHWVTEDRYAKDFGQTGECRRYPRPEETVSEYRCGEFICEPDHWTEARGSNLMQGFFERMHAASLEADKERTTRIALEKKLKALRKQMKTANAEVTGAAQLHKGVTKMGPDVENERTTKPDSAASALNAKLGAAGPGED